MGGEGKVGKIGTGRKGGNRRELRTLQFPILSLIFSFSLFAIFPVLLPLCLRVYVT
jgi:hypothetical protein